MNIKSRVLKQLPAIDDLVALMFLVPSLHVVYLCSFCTEKPRCHGTILETYEFWSSIWPSHFKTNYFLLNTSYNFLKL